MKRITNLIVPAISLLMLFAGEKAMALDYTISFTGSGASNTVQSVIAQNLTKGTSVTVPAGNVLVLTNNLTSVDRQTSDDDELNICPKPEEGVFEISFLARQAGPASVCVYSADGRKIAGTVAGVQMGESSFKLQLPKGFFIIQVTGNGYAYTAKMLSQTGTFGKPGVAFIDTDQSNFPASKKSKGAASTSLAFSAGDRILYKGISGNYCTIVTDIPTSSKTTNFEFVECKDANGNNYAVVKIGTQTWMAENLKASKYRNGDNVINFTNNTDWGMYSIGSWCNYDSEVEEAKYGKLYNWYAVNDSRNIAPAGWHVATDSEWTVLENYLIASKFNFDKTTTGNKIAKSLCSTAFWGTWGTSSTVGSPGCELTQNNASGLSIVPGGFRGNDGMYYIIGSWFGVWTSTEYSATSSITRYLSNTSTCSNVGNSNKNYGLSVRCVKDADLPTLTTATPSSITYTTAVGGGNVTNDGGAPITARGVCWSTSQNPTIADSKSIDGSGSGTFTSSIMGLNINTTYYVRAYATNSSGTAYGQQVVFNSKPYDATVTDVDGNLYHAITIGTQTWMVENLRTTKYNDGTAIPYISYSYDWTATGVGAYCWPNGSESNKNAYGAMYNWQAVNTRKLAPAGWHVPAKCEIDTLIAYLGGANVAGSKLKNAGNSHWTNGNADATNSSGFSALPAGYRSSTTGDFQQFGATGVWWTLAEVSQTHAYHFGMESGTSIVYPVSNWKLLGCCVRCIKNSLPLLSLNAPSSIMSTSVNCNGEIVSDGGESVTEYGVCWSTSQSPTISNFKKSVGSGIGAFSTSITGLAPNTTYYVRPYATNGIGTAYGKQITLKTLLTDPITVTDIDGNVYHTVTIGGQTWMVENLRTTKYRNGDAIGTTSSPYEYLTNAVAPKYQWAYNGLESNVATYGRLYTWYAVADTRNLAPAGWHVATAAEWTALQNYLIASGYNYDKTTTGNKIAKSICATSFWNINSTMGAPGCDLILNNATGFSVVPGGYRGHDGSFYSMGNSTNIWTATESSATTASSTGCGNVANALDINVLNKNYGFSVRCIKNSVAVVTSSTPTSVLSTTATCGGTIAFDGGETVTGRGLCWSTSQNPTISNFTKSVGSGTGTFSTSITGLTPNTTYYVRAYATNSIGTAYGGQMTIKTPLTDPVTVTDIDGNVYHTVTIGTQTWMLENLKTTKYNDGTSISLVTDSYQWMNTSTAAYCWTNNNITNKDVYGAMYNHYAVQSGKLAPAGWHVPTESDWMTLVNYLGGFGVSGSKLKETGIIHWYSPNSDATNETGFTALPGGYRTTSNGSFVNVTKSACFWSNTMYNNNTTVGVVGLYNTSGILEYGTANNPKTGFSVRCIKD